MFGSQALDTAIGLALMFFIFATAASAITEIYAAALNQRAKGLEKALLEMFKSGDLPPDIAAATDSDVKDFIKRATGRARVSYLSAKSFADAAADLVAKGQNIGSLQTKMDALARTARGRLDTVKAGLETWFDQTMAAAQDQYTKWASWFLFFTGLALAVSLNASLVHVGPDLWSDSATRSAVADAASSAGDATATCDKEGSVVEQAQCAVGDISAFHLPIGWGAEERDGWDQKDQTGVWWWLTHLVGWLLTAALLMLGAPFWFDLLGKLVNLRSTGPRPKSAPNDDASYSSRTARTTPDEPDHDTWVPNSSQMVRNLKQKPEDFRALGLDDRVALYRDAAPDVFGPPDEKEAQNVDWLATALNLGVPVKVVNDKARKREQDRETTVAAEKPAAKRGAAGR